MALTDVRCERCSAPHEVDDSLLGQEGVCFFCGHTFVLKADSSNLGDDSTSTAAPEIKKPKIHHTVRDVRELWGDTLPAEANSRISIRPELGTAQYGTPIPLRERRIVDKEAGEGEDFDYQLIEEIGKGGMGVVYRARQVSVDREVALKLMNAAAAKKAGEKDAFLTEAVVTANLDHPNIVPIHDLGNNSDGSLFYTMKEVKGTPWSDVILDRTEVENLQILMDVCDAVAYAHSRGVIHRDIKPQNVMLGDYGEVYVMDWGIAAQLDTEKNTGKVKDLTHEFSRAGTPAYMAPEMAQCDHANIGIASDIYLLGAILYEIVKGTPPHYNESIYSSVYLAFENIIPDDGEDSELLRIAFRAMDTNPDARYPDVKSFQQALRICQTHMESLSICEVAFADLGRADEAKDYDMYAQALIGFREALRQWPDNEAAEEGIHRANLAYAEAAYRKGDLDLASSLLDPESRAHTPLLREIDRLLKQRQARRVHFRLLVIGLEVVAVVIIALVVSAAIWIANEREKALIGEAKARRLLLSVEQEKTRALNAENALKRDSTKTKALLTTVQKQEEKAKEALELAKAGQARALDAEAKAKTERENALKAQKRAEAALAEMKRIREKEQKMKALLLKVREDEIKARQELVEREKIYYAGNIALADKHIRDGLFGEARKVLMRIPKGLWNWEWGFLMDQYNQKAPRIFQHAGTIQRIIMSDDGKYLVGIDTRGVVRSWNFESGELLEGINTRAELVDFSPATKHLIIANGRNIGSLYWDGVRKSTSQVRQIASHAQPITCLKYAAGGTLILSASEDKSVSIHDGKTHRLVNSYDNLPSVVTDIALADDHSKVITVGDDNMIRLWNRNSNTPYAVCRGHSRHINAIDMGTDDTLVSGSDDGTVRLWSLTTGKCKKVIQVGSAVLDVVFSPNGKTITACGPMGIKVFNTKNGQVLNQFSGHKGLVTCVQYVPDTDRLLSGGTDTVIRAWPQEATRGTVPACYRGTYSVRCLGKGDLLALNHAQGGIVTWNKLREKQGKGIDLHLLPSPIGIDASINGILATATSDKVVIWDTKGWKPLSSFSPEKGKVKGVVISPDGNKAISLNTNGNIEIHRWSKPGKPTIIQPSDGKSISTFAVSSDGKTICTGNNQLNLWNAETGAFLQKLGGAFEPVTAMCFFPDGKRLAVGYKNGTVVIWDMLILQRKLQFQTHLSEVSAIAVSNDGLRVVTGSDDKTLKVWDSVHGFELITLNGHTQPIVCIEFSPDGKTLYSADGITLREWNSSGWHPSKQK